MGRPPFTALARAYAASLGGDAFVAVALAGSLFFEVPVGQARPKIALYLLLTMTPFALVAPVLGPVLDAARTRRVTIAAGTCIARAALCVLMARHLHSLLFYPEAFGVLVLMKGFQVAKSSLVPSVVSDTAELVRANSRLTLAGVVGGAVAGGIAAGLLKLGGGVPVLIGGAVAYVVAAVLTRRVPSAVRPDAAPASEPERVLKLAGIRLAAAAMAVVRGGVGFLVFVLAFALKREGEPAWFYGAVIAVSSFGGLVGAVAAPRLRRAVREEAVVVAALVIPAGAALLGARSEARPAALTVALALGLGAAVGRAGFDSLVQRDAPDTMWGRAFARYEAYFQLAWVVGAFIPTLIAMTIGLGLLILALMLGGGALFYLAALAAESLVGARERPGAS